MHPSDLHRVRVLMPEDGNAEHITPPARPPSSQLSRQAALFQKYRQLADDAAQHAKANAITADAGNEVALRAEDAVSARHESGTHERETPGFDGTHAAPYDGFMPRAFALPSDAPEHDTSQDSGENDPDAEDNDETGHNGDERSVGGTQPPSSSATSDLPAGNLTRTASASTSVKLQRVVAAAPAGLATNAGEPSPNLTDYLLSQAAEFCSNPAVLARGNWKLTIPLDPEQLPECDLHLSLSYFDLVLRFETAHAESRRLISLHAPTLREQLAEMLKQAAPDTQRHIEIDVS